ncbi:MAG: hypothetical protein PWQ20_1791 [Thermotogaceae bacterium]|nr:hypothetical protein [Thermotogaceae bacterium]MDN5338721.1 hypothetical protein [Thermotogaceae bacterium]
MKMINSLIIIVLIISSVALLASERLYVYEPVKFSYVSASKEEGWYWCKSDGARIEWFWNPIMNIPDVFYVEYTLLITNKPDGGSGFDSQIKAELIIEEGTMERVLVGYTQPTPYDKPRPVYEMVEKRTYRKVAEGVLEMVNTFEPVYEGNTNGIGYEAHSYVKFDVPKVYLESLRQRQFKIVIYWPPLDNRNLFAANPDLKPLLIFKK